MGSRFRWDRLALVLAIAIVLIAGFGVGWFWVHRTNSAGSVTTTGQALIGGHFELVNQDGQTVTEKDFLGHNLLIYFGYTFCPDVCPTELSKITQAMDLLPDDANVIPVFITIDPERDTVEQVKSYVGAFHPKMVGLTGTPEQVREAARVYRVYYAKNTSSESTEYLMDHSSIIYLMGTDGQYLTHFSVQSTPEDIAAKVKEAL